MEERTAGPIKGQHNGVSPSGDLEKELPVIDYDLVSLSQIVERVTGQTYTDLVNLAEILPSTPDAARKRKIVEFVLHARRQLIKLLVLVRWSKDSDSLRKCMNIIGFLARQNVEFDRAVERVVDVKAMLAQARQRNYDLTTAVSVLTTGDYDALPTSLSDPYKEQLRLADQDVLDVLEDMNQAIRWRLACIESVPRPMRDYTIADGRATFTVADSWQAVMTYGGDAEDDNTQWYLLDLTFLFRVKDARGVFAPTPIGPMKEHIIELCNRELAPAASATSAPLERAYRFLQRLALNYKLESLYDQAVRVEKAWNNQVKVDFKDRKLRIDYWTQSTGKPAGSIAAEIATGRRPPRQVALDSFAAQEDDLIVEWLSEASTRDFDLSLDDNLNLEKVVSKVTIAHSRWSVVNLFARLKADLSPDIPIELVDRADGSARIRVKLFSTNLIHILVNSRTGKVELEPADPTSVVKEARLKSAADKVDKDPRTAADILSRLRLASVQDELESRLALIGLQSTRRLALRSADLSRFGSNTVSRSFLFVKLKHHDGYYMVILLLEQGAKVALMSTRVEADGLTSWLAIGEIGWLDMSTLQTLSEQATQQSWRATSREPPAVDPDIGAEALRHVYAYCQLRISYYRIELALASRRMSFYTVSRQRPSSFKFDRNAPPYLVVRSSEFLRSRPPPIPIPQPASTSAPASVLTSSEVSTASVPASTSSSLAYTPKPSARQATKTNDRPISHQNVAVQCFVTEDKVRTVVFVKLYDLDLVHFDRARLPSCVRLSKSSSAATSASTMDKLQAKSDRGTIATFVIDSDGDSVEHVVPTFLSAYAVFAKAIVEARYHQYKQSLAVAA